MKTYDFTSSTDTVLGEHEKARTLCTRSRNCTMLTPKWTLYPVNASPLCQKTVSTNIALALSYTVSLFMIAFTAVFTTIIHCPVLPLPPHTHAHLQPVKAVCWQKDLGCCVSGSWDKTLKVLHPEP